MYKTGIGRQIFVDPCGNVLTEFFIGVDDNDFYIITVICMKVREFGLKFVDTGAAVDIPEVNNGDLAAAIAGFNGAVFKIQRHFEIEALVTDFASNGNGIARGIGNRLGLHSLGILMDEVEINQTGCQHCAHCDSENKTRNFRALRQWGAGCVAGIYIYFLCYGSAAYFVGSKKNLGAFVGDGIGGADVDASTAADTFHITDFSDIHQTFTDAKTAVHAFGLIQVHAQQRDLVEQSVDCTQGAEEPTEEPINKYHTHQETHQQDEFPGEERTEHTEKIFVLGIGQQSTGAQQCSGGANVFTETW